MKAVSKWIVLVSMAALPMAVTAQEEEESKGFVYATYFYCDAGKADRASEIIKEIEAPNYAKAVEDGTVDAWGWLAHHTGGLWRRAQYYTAPSLNALLDAQTAMQEMSQESSEALGDEFAAICGMHEDYIWEVQSAGGGDEAGKATFSVYYVCDETHEERADEIFANDFAPILDKFVEDGKFTSWGWLSHWVGGKVRRLQTMSGADHKSLLAARGELIEAMYGDDNEAGAEFSSICGSHEDYMWDIEASTQ